jgi:hypothetical protein
MINLPKKDKNGNGLLSYSQISTFLKDKEEYKKRYIIKEKFVPNEYINFGNKVGSAIQNNNYDKFTDKEANVLKKLTRLDMFERKTILKYDGFSIIGFIDSCSLDYSKIIDYKTGGIDKEKQYYNDDYNQLHYYALSIRQELGITPNCANVEFIRRKGNLFKREKLIVAEEDPIIIEIDISESKLKDVYFKTINIAKQIESFYLENINL